MVVVFCVSTRVVHRRWLFYSVTVAIVRLCRRWELALGGLGGGGASAQGGPSVTSALAVPDRLTVA
jgi:hypothetical protein